MKPRQSAIFWRATRATAILLAVALVLPTVARALPAPQPPEPAAGLRLGAAERERLVEAAASRAETNYLFPQSGLEVASRIRTRLRQGGYDDLATGEALAAALTADMQAVVPDRHLKLLFSVAPRPMRQQDDEPSAAEAAHHRLQAARDNYGLERAEQLDGNVGYLKLTHFEDPALAGETLAAAMRFLSHTDALVIDLRFNGGGSSDMVALLTSYFVAGGPVHLVDFYDRSSGETTQSWTVPYVPGGRYDGKPLFILTGERTFSAAEQFAYSLQQAGRAVVVGERTGGGAHFVKIFQIDPHFAVMVPVGNVTSLQTGSNWEGAGITPDVAAASDAAVRTAHRLALEKLLETADDDRSRYLEMLVAELRDQG